MNKKKKAYLLGRVLQRKRTNSVYVCVCAFVRERERELIYFKKLAHVIVGADSPKFSEHTGRLETQGRLVTILSPKTTWK